MIGRRKRLVILMYTTTEPAISPFKPINRLLKIDHYHGTTRSRLENPRDPS